MAILAPHAEKLTPLFRMRRYGKLEPLGGSTELTNALGPLFGLPHLSYPIPSCVTV